MPGWSEKKGKIKKYIASEDELWSLTNYFFSPACKKTSTYKFGFFKAIIDSLFSGFLSKRGYEISFSILFEKFAGDYWNLIAKYHLRQMRNNGTSDYSRLEQIIKSVISQEQEIATLEFDSLNESQRRMIIDEITVKCKRNVVGATYQNFEGILYGYDLHSDGIWLNPVAYEFLLRHKFELEKLNYYAWAKKLEELNSDDVLVKLLDKLEDSTPRRSDLSVYRKILMEEFEINTCFYCGKKLVNNVSVDHVIPWKLVRENRIWNFVLACKSCNSKKSDRVPDKQRLLQVISRNEDFICTKHNVLIERECREYSSELMLKLWNYAKIGGYLEYEYEHTV